MEKIKNPEVLEKEAHRRYMQEMVRGLEIRDMSDINNLFKEMIGMALQNGL